LILIVTMITFFLMNLAPGGPSSMMRMDASAEERAALAEQYRLNDPVIIRYVHWLVDAVQGDLGLSLSTGESVTKRIMDRIPFTFQLTIWTIVVSVIIGIIFGIISAKNQNTWKDHMINFGSVIGLSVPSFWLAIMLILLFSVQLKWLPSSGAGGDSILDQLKSSILPVAILSMATLPTIVRFTRSS